MLSHGHKNPVNAIGIDERDELPVKAQTVDQPSCDISAKLDGLIAALKMRKGPNPRNTGSRREASPSNRSGLSRPDPKFEGCWHCGGKCPSRKKCEKFKKFLKDNNGKLPVGYQGAYEKFKAQQKNKPKVAAIVRESDDEEEFSETESLFCCVPCTKATSCLTCPPPSVCPTSTSNSHSHP